MKVIRFFAILTMATTMSAAMMSCNSDDDNGDARRDKFVGDYSALVVATIKGTSDTLAQSPVDLTIKTEGDKNFKVETSTKILEDFVQLDINLVLTPSDLSWRGTDTVAFTIAEQPVTVKAGETEIPNVKLKGVATAQYFNMFHGGFAVVGTKPSIEFTVEGSVVVPPATQGMP
jgi:hypothetical protein